MIEGDYDAEFRYDRDPVAALQGLAPEHVLYAGTVSKTLAPGLRLGWLVVPRRLIDHVKHAQALLDFGVSRIEQHALAAIIESGDFDRHLRRMRLVYGRRRAALVSALAAHLPAARVTGIAAGLHASVHLPVRTDEQRLADQCARRGIAIEFMSARLAEPPQGTTVLMLGYTRASEAGLRAGIRALGTVVAECSAAIDRGR